MYIQRRAFDDLPPGAIVLTEKQVVNKLQDTIFSWKPATEVWAFKYGPLGLSVYNLLTTANIAAYYSMRVRLPKSGNLFLYCLTAGTCGVLTLTSHHVFLQDYIFLQKECTFCQYARAVAFNTGMYGIYGILSAFFATALSANTLMSYPIPGFESWAKTKETVQKYATFNRKISTRFVLFPAVGSILTCALTWKQYQQFEFLNQQLHKREQRLSEIRAEFRATRPRTK